MHCGGGGINRGRIEDAQSNQSFDHILCDSAFIAETGSKFTAELSRAAPESRVYVLQRHMQFANPAG